MSDLIVIGLEWQQPKLNNTAIRLQLYPKSSIVGDSKATNFEEKEGNSGANGSSGTPTNESYVSKSLINVVKPIAALKLYIHY